MKAIIDGLTTGFETYVLGSPPEGEFGPDAALSPSAPGLDGPFGGAPSGLLLEFDEAGATPGPTPPPRSHSLQLQSGASPSIEDGVGESPPQSRAAPGAVVATGDPSSSSSPPDLSDKQALIAALITQVGLGILERGSSETRWG